MSIKHCARYNLSHIIPMYHSVNVYQTLQIPREGTGQNSNNMQRHMEYVQKHWSTKYITFTKVSKQNAKRTH